MVEYCYLESVKKFSCYDSINPVVIDSGFLKDKGIDIVPSSDTLTSLKHGSETFKKLFEERKLTTIKKYDFASVPSDLNLEIHNYTGKCPLNVFEVNPIYGSCSFSCLYCLVSDGSHNRSILVYEDYPTWILDKLNENKEKEVFFYYSPKTEAFCEPLLESGVAHGIMDAFRKHYKLFPQSRVRLFIATKAGVKHLTFKHEGESIIDILSEFPDKVQVNGSIGLMPGYLHDILEPNVPTVEDRLNALKMLQERGIFARSVLMQPIMPYYVSDESLDNFFKLLSSYGIENVKPEFLTVNMFNLAIISQYVNHYEPSKVKELLEYYISPSNQDHRKQRFRTAPNRSDSAKMILQIFKAASNYDISLSICEWVKSSVEFDRKILEKSALRGYRCLGYQQGLFNGNKIK